MCVLALVLVERDPAQALQLLDEASEVAAPMRDRFIPLAHPAWSERGSRSSWPDRPPARSPRRRSRRCSTSSPEQRDVASRWQLFAMAAYLLVHGPAADVATVAGIFEARSVENNRRQWLDGVARARAELGDDTFEQLVADGAALNDDEAIAFLCGRP